MINKKVVAEFIGTFLLTACVIGSGIMAENLSNGNARFVKSRKIDGFQWVLQEVVNQARWDGQGKQ